MSARRIFGAASIDIIEYELLYAAYSFEVYYRETLDRDSVVFLRQSLNFKEERNMEELQLVNSEGGLVLPEDTKEQLKSIIRSGIAEATLK